MEANAAASQVSEVVVDVASATRVVVVRPYASGSGARVVVASYSTMVVVVPYGSGVTVLVTVLVCVIVVVAPCAGAV